MLIVLSVANFEVTALTKVRKNDRKAMYYRVKKLQRIDHYKFLDEDEQKLAVKEKNKRVKKRK